MGGIAGDLDPGGEGGNPGGTSRESDSIGSTLEGCGDKGKKRDFPIGGGTRGGEGGRGCPVNEKKTTATTTGEREE